MPTVLVELVGAVARPVTPAGLVVSTMVTASSTGTRPIADNSGDILNRVVVIMVVG